jgi:predicted 2-oxoglutarate/Fe(II)-dependent dioxygenase YbiX
MKMEHLGNGVIVFRGLIPKDEISQFDMSLIEQNCTPQGFEKVDGKLYSKGGYEYDPDINGKDYPLRFSENIDSVNFTQRLVRSIYDAAVNYCKVFPTATECITEHKQFHYIKYSKDALMGAHSDCSASYKNDSIEVISNSAINNTLSTSIVLNDDFSGGEFEFPIIGTDIKLNAGDGLIYPSNFMGCHGVKRVSSGHRWAFLSFFAHARTDFLTEDEMAQKYQWTQKFRGDVSMWNYNQKKVGIGQI